MVCNSTWTFLHPSQKHHFTSFRFQTWKKMWYAHLRDTRSKPGLLSVALWWNKSSNCSFHPSLLRDVIKRIDQSEFEGFEYINPLLLATEESVWRRNQRPPPSCCSKTETNKLASQLNSEGRHGAVRTTRRKFPLDLSTRQTGGGRVFPWGAGLQEHSLTLCCLLLLFVRSCCPCQSILVSEQDWLCERFILCLPPPTRFSPSHALDEYDGSAEQL